MSKYELTRRQAITFICLTTGAVQILEGGFVEGVARDLCVSCVHVALVTCQLHYLSLCYWKLGRVSNALPIGQCGALWAGSILNRVIKTCY